MLKASSNRRLGSSPSANLSVPFGNGATRHDRNCKWCTSVYQPAACHRSNQVQLDGRTPGLHLHAHIRCFRTALNALQAPRVVFQLERPLLTLQRLPLRQRRLDLGLQWSVYFPSVNEIGRTYGEGMDVRYRLEDLVYPSPRLAVPPCQATSTTLKTPEVLSQGV
jgi:hypothetical protein